MNTGEYQRQILVIYISYDGSYVTLFLPYNGSVQWFVSSVTKLDTIFSFV